MLGTKLATSSCLPVCGLETLREPLTPSPPSRVALEFGSSSHVGLCSGAFWQTGTRQVERSELLGEETGLQSRQEVKGRENGDESMVWGTRPSVAHAACCVALGSQLPSLSLKLPWQGWWKVS